MSDLPKVWGDGNATIVTDGNTLTLYIGTAQIGMIESIDLTGNLEGISLTVRFPTDITSTSIEENMRLVKQLRWIRVLS